tara:strand:- start:8003 stop:8248 length:246 start_codon:yes stop_codon:yes gene_type:complete
MDLLPKKNHPYINKDNQDRIVRAVSDIDFQCESFPADVVWEWLGHPYNFEDNLRILEAEGRIELRRNGITLDRLRIKPISL